jgi:hypothetical protein
MLPDPFATPPLTELSSDGVLKPSIYVRTLQAAAELLGSDRALARYLQVAMPDLFAWMHPGAEPPPLGVFLKAVDVVMSEFDERDAERAQRLRVAAHHNDWSKAAEPGESKVP